MKAKEPLLQWYNIALLSNWQDFRSMKQTFNSVDSVGNDNPLILSKASYFRLKKSLDDFKATTQSVIEL